MFARTHAEEAIENHAPLRPVERYTQSKISLADEFYKIGHCLTYPLQASHVPNVPITTPKVTDSLLFKYNCAADENNEENKICQQRQQYLKMHEQLDEQNQHHLS